MPNGPDERRPLPKGRLDLRLRNDQAVLENMHPELRKAPPKLRQGETAGI